jgi:putative acetyltransferase
MDPAALTVRPARRADHQAIQALVTEAFGREVEAELIRDLEAAGRAALSLVAVVDGQLVGHVLLSPVTLDDAPEVPALSLSTLAVLPAWQRQGVGGALVRAALAWTRAQQCPVVVVLGHPDYYPRFGFTIASTHGLGNVYGVDAEFMAVVTEPLPRPTVVRYAPEFDRFGG